MPRVAPETAAQGLAGLSLAADEPVKLSVGEPFQPDTAEADAERHKIDETRFSPTRDEGRVDGGQPFQVRVRPPAA